MMKKNEHLKEESFSQPSSIAIHDVFANHSYEKLISTGVGELVACDTIKHNSNKVDFISLIVRSLSSYL